MQMKVISANEVNCLVLERASLPSPSLLYAICVPRISELELKQFLGQLKGQEIDLT